MAEAAPTGPAEFTVENYTELAKIRKRIRKVNDITIPLRRGVGIDQVVTGLVVLILLAILYGAIFSPLIAITHIEVSWAAYLIYFLAPTFLAAQKVSAPMKYGKTIPGTIISRLRRWLDDPVHRRGFPLPHRPTRARRMHYQREWQPKTPYAASTNARSGATDGQYFYEAEADLDSWIATHSVEHEQAAVEAAQQKKLDRAQRQTARLTHSDYGIDLD